MNAMSSRRGAALVLVGLLALAAAQPLTAGERQAPSRERAGARKPAVGLVGEVWGWMVAVWGKEGAIIIPDGFSIRQDRRDGSSVNDSAVPAIGPGVS